MEVRSSFGVSGYGLNWSQRANQEKQPGTKKSPYNACPAIWCSSKGQAQAPSALHVHSPAQDTGTAIPDAGWNTKLSMAVYLQLKNKML